MHVVRTSRFLPEISDLTERSGLSIASVHDESNSISNEVVIEDAKWLGKRRRKNKHENDDDEYKIRESSSGGGRSSRSSNGGSGRTRSSSNNANKTSARIRILHARCGRATASATRIRPLCPNRVLAHAKA